MAEAMKIVVVGDTDVGKTSIVSRYVTGKFVSEQNPTVGAGFLSKALTVEDRSLVLNIWDTAGQERFRSLAQLFYRDAQAIVIVYDITDSQAFEKLQSWRADVLEKGPKRTILAIVGTKEDRVAEEAVSMDEVKAYAQTLGALYGKTSALADVGINELFETIATRYATTEPPHPKNESIVVESSLLTRRKSCC